MSNYKVRTIEYNGGTGEVSHITHWDNSYAANRDYQNEVNRFLDYGYEIKSRDNVTRVIDADGNIRANIELIEV